MHYYKNHVKMSDFAADFYLYIPKFAVLLSGKYNILEFLSAFIK